MKVIDSSGWLEFFRDGPLADDYADHLKNLAEIVTPVIVLYEVYKIIKRDRSEEEAFNDVLALTAADISLEHGIAMADSIVYATAILHHSTLITSDSDLGSLPHVIYLKK